MMGRTLRSRLFNGGISGVADASVDCCVIRLGRSASGELEHQVRALGRHFGRLLRPEGSVWLLVEDGRSGEDLVGRPWRVAFALQDEGWLLRNAVVIESASGTGETVLFCVKQARYFFDSDAVRALSSSARGDVVLSNGPSLADRVVLAACPDGGVVLDLTETAEFELAAHRWGRKVIRIPSAPTAA